MRLRRKKSEENKHPEASEPKASGTNTLIELHVFLGKANKLQAPKSLLKFLIGAIALLINVTTQCPNHLYAGDHDETQPMCVMQLPVPDSTQVFSSPELSSDVRRAMYKGPDRNKPEETPTDEVPETEHVPLSGGTTDVTRSADKKGDFTDDEAEQAGVW